MPEETLVGEWADRSYTQGQAYYPYGQEKKHDVDYCLPSLEALGLIQGSEPRKTSGPSRSIHLRGFCPHFAAMQD